MTVFDWQADVVEGAAKVLAYWVSTTREDRLRWCPSAEECSCARCVIDQIEECIRVNRRFAALLRGETQPEIPETCLDDTTTGEAAGRELVQSAQELAAAIRGADESVLTRRFQMPLGTVTGADLMRISVGNMQYHGGQINLIQLLYGDKEFRIPPRKP